MSQRLGESAVRGTLTWFTEDERAKFRQGRHGLLSVPMGVRPDGRLIFPVAGASPDDPSNGDGSGGSGEGGEGGEGSGSEGQGGEGGTGSGSDAGGKESETVSKAELDKVLERMKAADRRAEAAEKKAKELEEKDLSEQEKALKQVPELQETVTKLEQENKKLTAKVAFLGLGDFSWHDPDVALAQVDLSEVFGEDGSIDKKALKKAAETLAKEKAFLVKSANDKGDGGKGGQNGGTGNTGGTGSSGSAAGSGSGRGAGSGVDEAALKAKYPALNV